mmetsp:Transcript_16759/g.33436  ORF Transcript_16759/g.33436 Transcript_16759/m.33436 type:complete len:279 (-) Transcript_16759:88-924(-)
MRPESSDTDLRRRGRARLLDTKERSLKAWGPGEEQHTTSLASRDMEGMCSQDSRVCHSLRAALVTSRGLCGSHLRRNVPTWWTLEPWPGPSEARREGRRVCCPSVKRAVRGMLGDDPAVGGVRHSRALKLSRRTAGEVEGVQRGCPGRVRNDVRASSTLGCWRKGSILSVICGSSRSSMEWRRVRLRDSDHVEKASAGRDRCEKGLSSCACTSFSSKTSTSLLLSVLFVLLLLLLSSSSSSEESVSGSRPPTVVAFTVVLDIGVAVPPKIVSTAVDII